MQNRHLDCGPKARAWGFSLCPLRAGVHRRGVFSWATLMVAAFWAGCARMEPSERIVFRDATIDHKPVRLLLDTCASTTLLDASAAKRLNIKTTPTTSTISWLGYERPISLTAPVVVNTGAATFSTALPTMDFSESVFASSPDFDGIIGWPEVRDNILVFDPETHTVRGVTELPAGTTDWLKLKIHPGDTLVLEGPLPNGGTGLIAVDTGQPLGALLPAPIWANWHATHPHALSTMHTFRVPFLFTFTYGKTVADELTLGPLTATNIPIREIDWKYSESGLLANLGVVALDRLNLIVDGIHGVAYVQPRLLGDEPTQGQDWSVDPSVRISSKQLKALVCSFDAQNKADRGDYAGAIAGFSQAIEFNPADARLYEMRAVQRQKLGDFSGALGDYEKYLERTPAGPRYELLYCLILRLRLGQDLGGIGQAIPSWEDGWIKTIGEYILGQIDEADLLQAAEKKDQEPVNGQRCEADYYIGIKHLISGDIPGARIFFQKSLASGETDYSEYQFARDELGRLGVSTPK
ncbi:MAG TPA: aspartyl protease family protein [Opitutales bacterium]|nr:aspartyl protease family protein [Opitutales bacterium]